MAKEYFTLFSHPNYMHIKPQLYIEPKAITPLTLKNLFR